jgi:hypothetical protein
LKEFIRYFSENLGLFLFVLVCYETDLFVSVVSFTETNPNFLFLVSRYKPKQTQNRSCFGLFRFQPKFIFVCFEETLTGSNNSNSRVNSSSCSKATGISQTSLATEGSVSQQQQTQQQENKMQGVADVMHRQAKAAGTK